MMLLVMWAVIRVPFFEVKDLNDQLYDEVLSGRKYLAKKELELSEAKQKLKVSDYLNREISATAQTLKMECENSKTICEDLGKHVPDKFNLNRSAPDLRDKRSELEQKTRSELRQTLSRRQEIGT
ncbi:hypothetical protein QQ045_011080 [Rhodiola kirilowii]